MRNILFVIDSLACGGAEKSLISLLSLLDYSKYSVDLLLFKRGGIFEQFVPEQVCILKPLKYSEFIRLPIKQAVFDSIKKLDFNMLFPRLKFTLEVRENKGQFHGAQLFWKNVSSVIERNSKEYDIAIGYSQGFPTYYVAEKVSAKKKIVWVNTNYALAGYCKDFDYRFYNEINKIVTVSNAAKDIFISKSPYFSKKIEVIYDIVNPDLIGQMAENGEGYTDNFPGVKLLTIGRLVSHKGYDIAVKAAKKLKEKNVNFRWYVLGEGTLRGELEENLKNNNLQDVFILLGAKSNPYPYIKKCDIYVQTSRLEGFGLAIAEARMLNKPVVTTKFDVVYDQMVNEKNGIVVDIDAEAVCSGIVRLLGDSGLRKSIVEYLKTEKKGTVEEFKKFSKLIEG